MYNLGLKRHLAASFVTKKLWFFFPIFCENTRIMRCPILLDPPAPPEKKTWTSLMDGPLSYAKCKKPKKRNSAWNSPTYLTIMCRSSSFIIDIFLTWKVLLHSKKCRDALVSTSCTAIDSALTHPRSFYLYPKLYIPSTLNIDLILWHTQLIVCAVKC